MCDVTAAPDYCTPCADDVGCETAAEGDTSCTENRFGTWNRVLIFYCSSDQWSGTKANTVTATSAGGASVTFGHAGGTS